jgi:hypothetical protein
MSTIQPHSWCHVGDDNLMRVMLRCVNIGDVDQVEAHFSPFGDNFNLDANRCLVCTEHTIGLEIILGAIDGTPT